MRSITVLLASLFLSVFCACQDAHRGSINDVETSIKSDSFANRPEEESHQDSESVSNAGDDLQICGDDQATTVNIHDQMVGQWQGVASTPWTDPYEVRFTFEQDGSYSAHADGETPALYYGVDDDTPLKSFAIQQVDCEELGTAGRGSITFYYGPYTNSTGEGLLRSVSFSEVGQAMTFEIMNGVYGPLHYYMRRSTFADPRRH